MGWRALGLVEGQCYFISNLSAESGVVDSIALDDAVYASSAIDIGQERGTTRE